MTDLPAGLRGPVDVALAAPREVLPAPNTLRGGAVYELKWDGFRCAAVVGDTGVRLWSRQGRELTGPFPDVAAAVTEQVPPGTVLDGELVIWDGTRMDFDLLQRRLATGPKRAQALAADRPASYVAFDVLAHRGEDLRERPLGERRRVLDGLGATWRPPLQVSPATGDPVDAAQWASDYRAVGIEGLMAKAAAGPYRPGRRDWFKVKTRESAEAIVGAVTGSLVRPQTLVLGRVIDGALVMVGRTVPLGARQAATVGPLLARAEAGHPWPGSISVGWGSRERIRITRVTPVVVVEVAADSARTGGKFRHPVRFLRHRPDLAAEDVE